MELSHPSEITETGELPGRAQPARDFRGDRAGYGARRVGTVACRPSGARWSFRRDQHTLTYVCLFLFTFVLYFRPYELIPGLAGLSSMARWSALATLAVFIPSQLALERRLSARLPEVRWVLLLGVAAILSMPLALDRAEALRVFTEQLAKVILIFIVLVNVVRTERRLKGLLVLALGIGVMLSLQALDNYRQGRLGTEGYRVAATLGGMFGGTNDMAIHLVMMAPIAVGWSLGTRSLVARSLLLGCALVLVGGVMVTYSRGAFLALVAAAVVLAVKLRRRHAPTVLVVGILFIALFVTLAPANYATRLASILDPSLDPVDSANSRRALLTQSLVVISRNPVFGVGIGNFHTVSIREAVSHNAFTEVAAEMGIPAGIVYILFLACGFRRVRRVQEVTARIGRLQPAWYLAVGLQSALAAYVVAAFFASIAAQWYGYFAVGYAVVLCRIIEGQLQAEHAAASPQHASGGLAS